MDGADQRADLAAQDVLQRGSAREDRGHAHPELGQRGRHLAPDEPHAHDDRAPVRHRLPLDRVAVGHRAQVVDPGQAGPGDPEPPVPPSGGYQELVVPKLLARVQDDRVRGGIDGFDARSAETVYVMFGVPAGRPDIPAFEILLRPQVGLGQRRTTEGDARFLADDHDRSRKTLRSEGCGGVAPRDATADDHDRAHTGSLRHQYILPSRFSRASMRSSFSFSAWRCSTSSAA